MQLSCSSTISTTPLEFCFTSLPTGFNSNLFYFIVFYYYRIYSDRFLSFYFYANLLARLIHALTTPLRYLFLNYSLIIVLLSYQANRYVQVSYYRTRHIGIPALTIRSLFIVLVLNRDFFGKLGKSGPYLVPILTKSL